jgi:hypothetical protein
MCDLVSAKKRNNAIFTPVSKTLYFEKSARNSGSEDEDQSVGGKKKTVLRSRSRIKMMRLRITSKRVSYAVSLLWSLTIDIILKGLSNDS